MRGGRRDAGRTPGDLCPEGARDRPAGRPPPAGGHLREGCFRASPVTLRGRTRGRRWEQAAGVQRMGWRALRGGPGRCVCARVRGPSGVQRHGELSHGSPVCPGATGVCPRSTACSLGSEAGWSRRVKRGRAGLCARVWWSKSGRVCACVWALPPAVPGAVSCLGAAASVRPFPPGAWSLPGTLPLLALSLSTALRPGPAPGFLESPEGCWGGP